MSYCPSRRRASVAASRARCLLALTFALGACSEGSSGPGEPPVASDLALETAEDTPVEAQLTAEGNGALTFTVVDAPDHGTTSEVGADGAITYTPAADFHGVDTLVFRATDVDGRSDEATVTITITPVNDAPTLTSIANQTIDANGTTDALAFTVSDVETEADELEVTATSSNTALVPNDPASLVLGGAGASRTLTVVPAAGASGTTTITLSVSDGEATTDVTFTVDVLGPNVPPTIDAVADQRVPAGGTPDPLTLTVGDAETSVDDLVLTATSANTALVPNEPTSLVLGGAGASRTLTIVPVADVTGDALITLTVSDGTATASTAFTFTVAAPARLFWVTAADELWRADVNGANAVELATGISGAYVIATDPEHRAVYYSRGSAIVRINEDGTNPVDVVANGGYPSGLAVDTTNDTLYWSDFNGSRVMRADLDGQNPSQVIGGINSASGLAVDEVNGKVYVITYNNTQIIRFNLNGSSPEPVASMLGGQGLELALDPSAGKMYFSTRGDSIYVANLDGSNVTALVTGQNTVHGIDIDVATGRLYWTEWLGQRVRSARLSDGGDVDDVEDSESRHLGLAWMPAPE